MNISHKHKTIWWAPERTGTKITREILWNYDFFVYDPILDNEVSLKERYTSHLNSIPEKYSDYTLICNIRNPYDRILSHFLLTRYQNAVLDKNSHNQVKQIFNKWLLKLFKKEKLFVKIHEGQQINDFKRDVFLKWTFSDKIPNYFIKMETLQEDLENVEFIKNDPEWNSSKIEELLRTNKHKTNHMVKFDEIYEFDTAKLVYFYYKKVFMSVPYDPFSFTRQNLSNSEKMSFLHDII